MNENFYNFSPTADTSGNITLSLSDLMTLIGSASTASSTPSPTGPSPMGPSPAASAYGSYNTIRDDIKKDVRNAVKDELLRKEFSEGGDAMDDSCIDSLSAQQGADFMRYIPGKNPDDYIRKDSVPCYGCSIPT